MIIATKMSTLSPSSVASVGSVGDGRVVNATVENAVAAIRLRRVELGFRFASHHATPRGLMARSERRPT